MGGKAHGSMGEVPRGRGGTGRTVDHCSMGEPVRGKAFSGELKPVRGYVGKTPKTVPAPGRRKGAR